MHANSTTRAAAGRRVPSARPSQRRWFRPWRLAWLLLFAGLTQLATAQNQFEAWKRVYNGSGGGNDDGRRVAVDGSGNVYMGGTVINTSNGNITSDFIVRKYNSAGTVIWTRFYNTGFDWNENLRDMSVDGPGNVYLTGSARPLNGNASFLTVKFNASGTFQWAKTYSGSNEYATPNDMSLDGSGNLYVAGVLDNKFLTIKYSASTGTQQWAKTFSNGANTYNEARGVGWDASGNVYAGGASSSSGEGFYDDYTLVKYNASGTQQWVRRYDGSPGASGNDRIEALTLDGSANIYVTGYSEGTGTQDDYATVKYSPAGTQLWAKRYNNGGYDQAAAIVRDNANNIYVTGFSAAASGENDFLTIKYNSSGTQQWAKRFDGAGDYPGDDYAKAIRVDGSGNVYVTGYGSNSANDDWLTVKYNSAGTLQWNQRFQTGGGTEQAYSLALDGSGNVYVAGITDVYNGFYDIQLIKYVNPSGNNVAMSSNPVSACSGTYYDPGYTLSYQAADPNSPYLVQTITPTTPGAKLRVTFTSFNLVNGQDFLSIYNGASTSSPVIGAFTGTNSPGTRTATSSGGQLTFQFYRSSLGGASGWAATISCISSGPSTVRLNTGGASVTTNGRTFAADANFTGSTAVSTNSVSNFANTTDDVLYRDARRAANNGGSFGYNIPVSNGTYTVRLHFAETYFGVAVPGGAGKRVFDVTAEGSTILNDYDIYKEVGSNAAAVKTATVAVSDGTLSLSFNSVVEKAVVSAIEVVPAAARLRFDGEPEGQPLVQTFAVQPNPARERTTLAFSLRETQRVQLAVFDAQGKPVAQLFDGEAEGGRTYEVEWQAAPHPSGVYLGRLVTQDGVEHRKIVLQR
jgi:uncharacterized delta-60 repeat protein